MTVDYEVIDDAIRINCLNWVIEPSVEDSEACMAVVIDVLQEVKKANEASCNLNDFFSSTPAVVNLLSTRVAEIKSALEKLICG